jgi:hypothetical protein
VERAGSGRIAEHMWAHEKSNFLSVVLEKMLKVKETNR